MKLITKLSLIAATVAALGSSAAFADDQQLQNRLALRAHDMQVSERTPTVAVYANQQGVGRAPVQSDRPEPRFELRANAHGQTFSAYEFAK